ncbi:MAG: exosome complex exonuclease Rrp41, partial [Candidatus Micrarchaeota archaeon]|nr:exosome complex exonuclease Rrp41 [Candidatus Micrarchaeota archaeon]
SRRSSELSKVIREVFESVVDMGRYPKTEISLSMEVLQADGGTRTASLTAASVALANAGIPMRDLVAGVAVGKADGQIVVDLAKEEDNFGESDIPLAILPRSREILLFQQDGLLTREEIDRALEMAFEAAEKVHKVQIEALKRAYS